MGIDGLKRSGVTRAPSLSGAETASSSESVSKPPSAETPPVERSALDKVTGSSSSSSSALILHKAGGGARAALAGLMAVEPKAHRYSPTWKAGVITALLSLSIVGGVTAPARAAVIDTRPSFTSTMGLPEHTGPPAQRSAFELKLEEIASQVSSGRVHEAQLVELRKLADERRAPRLPDTIATLTSGVNVIQGSDPGDFYCEHAFFTSTNEAFRANSSILKNRAGEVLTGFLHVPSDAFTYDATTTPVQAERHADRREVVGAAIRGLFEEARPQLDALSGGTPFRLLLTGYAQWGGVVNNPTGDFVVHTENIDAAMKHAFGDALKTPHGRMVEKSDDGERHLLEYTVVDGASGKPRQVFVDAARLPVSDDAIDGGPRSLQQLIQNGQPHAVMSMGVAGGSSAYQAEWNADDGGLGERDGRIVHDDAKSPVNKHPANHALGRAIQLGTQIIATPAPGGV